MKKLIRPSFFLVGILLTACVHESSMPLGNGLMQIDVSAAPIYGRAGAQRIAYENAAKATLEAGYDKFIVLGNQGWSETSVSAANYNSYNASGAGDGYKASSAGGGFFSTFRNPESTITIRMFHYKDAGADKAIDANQILRQKTN